MFDILYRGFDGLDVAFQGALKRDFLAQLESAKAQAQICCRPVRIEYSGIHLLVAETGAPNGYAFRCDTGLDGAIWFFKRGVNGADWNFRVSVKSMALALYGLGAVRAGIYDLLHTVADKLGEESIGRVDFAIDVLAPGFALIPDHFVMHSHTDRSDRLDHDELQISGRSNRVTSVTIGHMPRRQLIVYDKRAEVIKKHKTFWWEIWNASRHAQNRPIIDSNDRIGASVWRIELRAGKEHLKNRWGIRTWTHLDNKLGDLFLAMHRTVRYTAPNGDTNRSRWPNHAIWDLVSREISNDLFEMISGVDPQRVKRVYRAHLKETIVKQIIGSTATYSIACELESQHVADLPRQLANQLGNYLLRHRGRFEEKRDRASERYQFIEIQSSRGRRSTNSP